uniref:Codanin-1 C-terminal domain-containing protein n=1 Tax=Plectus sambesii TaxID=2011161 RepID=A0A914XEQ6_9BILA
MPGLSSSTLMEGGESISAYLRRQCPFLSTPADADQATSPDGRKMGSSTKEAAQTPLIAPAARRQNRRSHEVPAAVPQMSPKKKYSTSPRKQPFLSSPSKCPPSRNNRARKALTLASFISNGEGRKPNDDAKMAPLFSVESSDDFPSLGAATPPVKLPPVRRIRPTPVPLVSSNERNCLPEEPLAIPSIKLPAKVAAPTTNSDASEREKLLTKRLDSVDPVTTPAKAPRFNATTNDSVVREIDPSFELVTRRSELDTAAQTFVQFLEMECTGIFRELQFVVALLCVHSSSEARDENAEPLLLDTVHNCVYLACTVLQELEWLVLGLDDRFVEELASNDRLNKFATRFCDTLRSAQPQRKSNAENFTLDSLSQPVILKRDEFPDQTSFHAFKRQRDIYHEIKRDYDETHFEKDVAYFEVFGNRVRGLIKSGSHMLNYALLSQLFISEIVKNDPHSINCSSHQNFPDADVERLNRLTRRLTTCDTDDISSSYGRKPKFVGRERFFRDFLLHSDSYLFTTSLRDQLWAKIKLIWRLCREQNGDITALLRAACILAKFLGYITFQPYQQSHQFPASLHEASHESDSITLQVTVLLESLLKNDDCTGVSIYGIIICHFLSIADFAFLSRENNKGLVLLLLAAFRCIVQAQRTKCYAIYMSAVFHIDWLLSMPHMICSSYASGKSNIMIEDDLARKAADFNQQITVRLNDTCPWLSSLHSLLLGSKQSSETPAQRKIRPITLSTSAIQQGDSSPQNRVLAEMERQFFAQQPALVRKVVDTVTECFTHPSLSSSEIDEPEINAAVHSLLSKCSSDCVIEVAQKLTIRNVKRNLSERPPPKSGSESSAQRDEVASVDPSSEEPFQELGPLLQRMRVGIGADMGWGLV